MVKQEQIFSRFLKCNTKIWNLGYKHPELDIILLIRDNSNASLGIVDCSLYTGRNALKDDFHKKRRDMHA